MAKISCTLIFFSLVICSVAETNFEEILEVRQMTAKTTMRLLKHTRDNKK